MTLLLFLISILFITTYAYVDDISCFNYITTNYCNHNIFNYFQDKLTFIIPSIGRDTLMDTIRSLLHQTNSQWKAIVIFDGIDPTIVSIDKRITIMKSDKLGEHVNSAGNVRNYGIQYATTEWVAFLDDDDSISNDYVDKFFSETKEYSDVEFLLFRMLDEDQLKPSTWSEGTLKYQEVGISFAVKKTIFDQGVVFIPSPLEDFTFITKCINNGYVLMLSPFTTYYVRQYEPVIIDYQGDRIMWNRLTPRQ